MLLCLSMKTQTDATGAHLLSRQKVALRWNCSVESVKRAERRGLLKPIKLVGLIRHRIADLVEIENAHCVPRGRTTKETGK